MSFVEEQYSTLVASLDRQFATRLEEWAAQQQTNFDDDGSSPLAALLRTPPNSRRDLTPADSRFKAAAGPADGTETEQKMQAHRTREHELRRALQKALKDQVGGNLPVTSNRRDTSTTSTMMTTAGTAAGGPVMTELHHESSNSARGTTTSDKPPPLDKLIENVGDLQTWHDELLALQSHPTATTQGPPPTLETTHAAVEHPAARTADIALYEWWLASRLAAGLYASTMQLLLDTSLPLMQEIEYWESQDCGSWQVATYLLSTAPARLYGTAQALLNTHGPDLVKPLADLYRRLLPSPRETLVDSGNGSREVSGTTPLARLANVDATPHWTDQPAQSTRQRARALRGAFHGWMSSLFPDLAQHLPYLDTIPSSATSILRLGRQEIRQKQHQLRAVQQYLAVCMGLFMTDAARLQQRADRATSGDAAIGTTEVANDDNNGWTTGGYITPHQLVAQVTQMQAALTRLNDQATNYETVVFSAKETPIATSALTTDDGASGGDHHPADLTPMLNSLAGLTTALQTYQTRTRPAVAHFYSPAFITRYWLPVTTTLVLGRLATRWALAYRGDVRQWLREAQRTAQDYIRHWVVKPLHDMWQTIRHENGDQLVLASAESLRSDLASLERMVVEFAQEHPTDLIAASGSSEGMMSASHAAATAAATTTTTPTTSAAMAQLIRRVREGDLSVVLRTYERDLQHPIRGALFGDLIRALLIQVQKTKVDLGLAMSSLDKLLRANELNFAFLAVAPALCVLYFVGSRAAALIRQWRGGSRRRAGVHMRAILRSVDRLLTLYMTDAEPPKPKGQDGGGVNLAAAAARLPYEAQGFLLCLTNQLRYLAADLPDASTAVTFTLPVVGFLWAPAQLEIPNLRRRFIEDVQDLENPRLSCTQRTMTIQRMFRTYHFL
ncbi:Nuclear control of ATPase protein 2 [Tieghemiomyces parasiticus]|uniref:Nuclear control of ATPase protein 2 n=1 Tax=Tieghemiomyces parasiticus TaxID=78921 RepID=A0A9W7ZWG3_9FUNG|nr:Nuclear control of ATPase protein 2 [Tieghemiomyces parasiticus]